MKAAELNYSIWSSPEDSHMHITKMGRGYYGIGDKFDFERKNAKETIAQLKKWGYTHIGWEEPKEVIEQSTFMQELIEEENYAMFAAEVAMSVMEKTPIETMVVEKAMSAKNPTVKKYLAEGWVFVGKEWSSEKNMYLATLERTSI